ncbi:sulfate transporter family protein [Consotaella salsifontis]|uniref:CysZ protein n=1 Tax=Consotaella salsifontis TaxID=1365950 RepID=A0A1T4QQ13_9HYPH|nr:sulfate transporter family protein [Consotaella salsifontis]SKA05348.1 CysZ protein [Consotaella salsifontis]
MIASAAALAFRDLFSPPFRAVLWKSLGLTLAVLVALWFGFEALFQNVAIPFFAGFAPDMPAWLSHAEGFAGWAAGLLLALLLGFLIAPISAIIAGFFLDDVAETVERTYPQLPQGEAVPFVRGLILSLRFLGVVILGNLIAFALLLVPGVNLVAFFVVNGYLLGREYFEFAALRFRAEEDAKALRLKHGTTVFLAGLVIAAFLAVPILNLLTPLFAAALMVHLHQKISAKNGSVPIREPVGADRLR